MDRRRRLRRPTADGTCGTRRGGLGEDELAALWLHYVDQLPVGEIAVVLDRSRVAVKTMMFRARKKLLPLVGELEPGK